MKDYISADYLDFSGIWIRERAHDAVRVVQNPQLISPPVCSETLLKCTDKVRAPLFSEREFNGYAEAIQQAGDQIKRYAPDIILVPMRGGIRPWLHIQIYCGLRTEPSCVFPFTGEEKNSDDTKEIILRALLHHEGSDALKIACIDTAKGGNGSRQLLNILSELHEAIEKIQAWHISLFLFVPEERKYASWKYEHEGRSHLNFQVKVPLIPVETVVGEDLEAGMINLQNFDRYQRLKIRSSGATFLIETAELPAVLDQKITHSIHELLDTEPGTRLKSVIGIRRDGESS